MLANFLAAALPLLLHAHVHALPQGSPSSVPADTSLPVVTFSTSVASPTVPLTNTLPSQVPLPPVQAWCPSQIFCAGELLQTVNLAQVYSDAKTVVDKPTNKPSQQVLSDFNAIDSSSTTEGDIVSFMDNDFRGEGLELEAVAEPNFNPNPAFLSSVKDPLIRAWSQTVHTFWTQLIRNTNQSALCPEGTEDGPCESSLIPLNHTYVIPGGRFREQYYWDSYWILVGLLKSELFDVANATLQNFMDEIEKFGFIPNGGRIYYLNRSQPPLFVQMLSEYTAATNDTSILHRALPLAEVEMSWWSNNRSVSVTSPFTNQSYTMFHYAANNTAPRPESYLEDYMTANDPTLTTPLTEDQRSDLYSELASGAETGWDYSSRWAAQPFAGGTNDTNPLLRSLNVRNLIPVCLNSMLYNAHIKLSDFYNNPEFKNSTANAQHNEIATNIRNGILDLMWDSSKLAFYDFNLTANGRSGIFTAATFYPLWNNIFPDEILNSTENAFGFFSALNMVLNRYNGTFPATFLETGQQWDAPNAWPPHQYIALQALAALPSNIKIPTLSSLTGSQSTFDLIPSGQIGVSEDALPGQKIIGTSGNATKSGSAADINMLNGTVVNGGNATSGESWVFTLERELANRYIASALCSWHATGGSIPGVLPRLSDQELNVTQSANNTGNMFEKFSISDIDSAGSGGEYTVQAGFGWTNGVALWAASQYGDVLVAPNCPDLLAQVAQTSTSSTSTNAALSVQAVPSATTWLGMLVVAALTIIV
ncbi:glycoside hydrolase family 37 protein [Gelatoporia subvermispora B]|uniref:Trehalase n=1 Tax=Ceriporiopsis subvermispora (strain B) TaxID=914234 RepID=M2PSG0_CERS8|nr:glycoside hydrolase family 37 protein [Gelatoporia subvermispora B]